MANLCITKDRNLDNGSVFVWLLAESQTSIDQTYIRVHQRINLQMLGKLLDPESSVSSMNHDKINIENDAGQVEVLIEEDDVQDNLH